MYYIRCVSKPGIMEDTKTLDLQLDTIHGNVRNPSGQLILYFFTNYKEVQLAAIQLLKKPDMKSTNSTYPT